MTTKPGPYPLDEIRMIIGPDAAVTPKPVTETFYQELDHEFDGFAGHILIQTGEFAEAWPTWEVHPKGDELVYLLYGDVDFVLWVDGEEQALRVSQPGGIIVVPRNTWHTARPHAPTKLLFITPGEGTLNAERPES